MTTKTTKTYRYIIVDAPGYCGNRARIYSRHSSLAAAKKALHGHYVTIPGIPRGMSACIVNRETSRDTDFILWNAVRDAGYEIHGIDD